MHAHARQFVQMRLRSSHNVRLHPRSLASLFGGVARPWLRVCACSGCSRPEGSRSWGERELARLTQELAHHDALYYNDGTATLSDDAYDALRRRALRFERLYGTRAILAERVGAPVPDQAVGQSGQRAGTAHKVRKVRHAQRMLSLASSHDVGQLRAFFERIRRACSDFVKAAAADSGADAQPTPVRTHDDARLNIARRRPSEQKHGQ